MKILFRFSSSIYNCDIIITDIFGTQNYFVNLEEVEPNHPYELEIDIRSYNFELTVIPRMVEYKAALSDMEVQDWKDKLARKLGNAMFSMLDKMLLRVGCTYVISGAKENDVIHLCGQEYVFGTLDKFDVFELIPMAYMFFEASRNGVLCKCSNAFPTNRKEVISCAKKLTLLDFGAHLIFTYPVQVGRIKKLTSDKKVRSTLTKFNRLSEQDRQKVLQKKEKFMSR